MNASGKTGEPLKVELPSAILRARWTAPRVAAGGSVAIEVLTRFVADGSPIEIQAKWASGKTFATLKGQIHADTHRRRIEIPGDAREDCLFTAKLADHKLEESSPLLAVIPGLAITETRWFDPDGKELDALQDGKPALGKARIQGRPDGSQVEVEFVMTESDGSTKVVGREKCQSRDSAIEARLTWTLGDRSEEIPPRRERERQGESYRQPSLHLIARCDGIEASSAPIPIAQEMILRYQSGPETAGPFKGRKVSVTAPDGKKQEFVVPDHGVIVAPKTLPGRHDITIEEP
jgi:hypothetical protein